MDFTKINTYQTDEIIKRKPYEQVFKHKEDFLVKYRFFDAENGGRPSLPFQGIRSDFWYESPDHEVKGYFMIYPEFEDEEGNIIEEGSVLKEGNARMWILMPQRRLYHQKRIKIGTIGYFKEGGFTTAICEVIKIVGLLENPVK